MALVAITLLNDGLIISICKDKVVAAAKPQMWELREIFTVATALGFVLVVENCLLLLCGMKTGPGSDPGQKCGQDPSYWAGDDDAALVDNSKCTGFLPNWIGDADYGTVTYKQVKTMLYLSLSLSSFLTVMSARTRGAFFERRLGYLLMTATGIAFLVTTALSMSIESISESLEMENLSLNQVGFIWLYVLVGFAIQDLLVKRSVYACYDWYKKDIIQKSATDLLHAVISTQIEEERLTLRRTSASVGAGALASASGTRGGSSRFSQASDADGAAGIKRSSAARGVSFGGYGRTYGRSERESVLEAKLDKLQKELNEVKDVLAKKKNN